MLPEIKSDLDGLERLAASFYDASSDPEMDTLNDVSRKIRLAIMDIQNLRDALTEEWSQYYENFKRDNRRNVN